MIKVVSKNYVKLEEIEKFKELVVELIQETLKEEGCISYNLYEDINNKQILTFIEEWKDKKAIELHRNSAHFKNIIPQLAKFHEKEKDINLYKNCF
jgi:quinol monooxygenase YgiN